MPSRDGAIRTGGAPLSSWASRNESGWGRPATANGPAGGSGPRSRSRGSALWGAQEPVGEIFRVAEALRSGRCGAGDAGPRLQARRRGRRHVGGRGPRLFLWNCQESREGGEGRREELLDPDGWERTPSPGRHVEQVEARLALTYYLGRLRASERRLIVR